MNQARSLSALIGVAAIAAMTALTGTAVAQAPSETTDYKQSVAKRIISVAKATITKAPVRALAVVGYTVDVSGNLLDAWIVRSAGESSLDDSAISMLKRAVPLPVPPSGMFGADTHTHLSEAFVFTVDGRFRLQSLLP